MQSTAPPTPPQPDLSKMQPPPPQQLFVPATVNNSTGNARTNQQGSIYRGPATTTAQRSTARHVPAIPQMFSQQLHQQVVLPYPAFAARQQAYQQPPSFPYAQQLPTGFPYPYQYYSHNSMISTTAQTLQRGHSVQTGPTGPLGGPSGTQAQLQLAGGAVLAAPVPASAAVLGVASSGQQTIQPISGNNPRKKRLHALDIIHPDTKKNVLDELDLPKQSGPNSDLDYQDQLAINAPLPDLGMVSTVVPHELSDASKVMAGNPYNIDMIQRTMPLCQMNDGQTPIVSAITDGPSVEIRPSNPPQQKRKNKSIPIVAPPDHKDNKSQTAKTGEDILSKAIKPDVFDTSTETLSVISTVTDLSSLNKSPTASTPPEVVAVVGKSATTTAIIKPVVAAAVALDNSSTENELKSIQQQTSNKNQYPPGSFTGVVSSVATETTSEDTTASKNISSLPTTASSSPTSTLSTLSSASTPTSIAASSSAVVAAAAATSTATATATIALKDSLTVDQQDIDIVAVNELAKSVGSSSGISETPITKVQQPFESMKLSEVEMNVIHVNTQTLPDDLVDNSAALIQAAIPPSSLATTNGNEDATKDATTTTLKPQLENDNSNNNKIYKLNDNSLDINSNNNNIGTTIGNNSNVYDNTSSSKNTASNDETDRSIVPITTTTNFDNNTLTKPVTVLPKADLVNNNNSNTMATNESSDTNIDQSINESGSNNNQLTASKETTPLPSESSSLSSSSMAAAQAQTENGDIDDANIDSQESPEITAPGKSQHAPEQSAAIQAAIQSLINYNEGQWSPQNPTGKKQYDRDQLLQLREAKASQISPDVSTINASILPQPNLLPAFVRGNSNNKRVQSMGGIGSMGDRSGMGMGGMGSGAGYMKQASMSGVNQRNSSKGSRSGMFHINLSLNQDVKLNETHNAWRPRVLVSTEGSHDSEELKRRVRGILNKLTPEKFDTLVEQIIKLKIDTNEKVNDVMELVFEKAIDEPNFSVSYARLCQRLVDEVKARDERTVEGGTQSNLKQFRTSLLDKTENEFNKNVAKRAAKEQKLQPILDKIRDCKDPNEKLELQAQLEEEERKIRRRSGGTVRFIGELFKISMLTGKIIHSCIELLLDSKSEDKLECLCKLLTTVGEKFEKTVNSKVPSKCYSLDDTVRRMQAIASKTDKEGAKISSRVRFMLQDVIDLRKNKWISSRGETPKTMEEIQKQAKTEQMSTQYMNYSNMMSGSGGNMSGGNSGGQSSGGGGGNMKKDDRRFGNNAYGNNRDGSRGGGRNDDNGSMRRQQNQSGGNNMGSNGGNSNNSDDTWHHVQTGKGNRSICAVDTNKLESMLNDLDMGSKKMGGLSQFLWNSSGGQSRPATTASNSFAALSTLMDSKSNDRNDRNDRIDRNDRGGQRNKGSYNKSSMERDRYDRGVHSRGGSAHGSRESSSSRSNQGRGMMNASNMQKSASHNKNQYQSMAPRMQGKSGLPTTSSMSPPLSLQQQSSHVTSNVSSPAAAASPSVDFASVAIAPLAVFDEPSDAEQSMIRSAISEMVEIAANSKTLNAVVPYLTKFKENLRSYFVFMILAEYLHFVHVGQVQRRYAAKIVAYYFECNYISLEHFKLAYERFCELISELIIDVPELWTYIFEFSGPLITKKIITVKDLWNKELAEQTPMLGVKFLTTFLMYCTREIGPDFTRVMWKNSNLKWTDFVPESEVADFIKKNKFEFVNNASIKPHIVVTEDKSKLFEKVVERVEHLLEDDTQSEPVIDYINGNIVDIDKEFVRSLTTAVCNFAIKYKDNTYKLEPVKFRKICIPIITRVIDSKEELELETLYAMQLLCNRLEHPRGLLSELFGELYDTDVMPQETFLKWRDSKEEALAGKGVAVKGLNPFFNQLMSGETSDETN